MSPAKNTLRASKDLEEMYNEEGEVINYEEIQNTASRVASGVYQISRLTREAEEGRIAGGRVLLEASILLGAAEKTSPTIASSQIEDGWRLVYTPDFIHRKIVAPQEKLASGCIIT